MKPTVILFAGDPAGIGSEIVAKALRDPSVHMAANIILVGSRPILDRGMNAAGAKFQAVHTEPYRPADGEPIQLACWEHDNADDFEVGQISPRSGAFMLDGLAHCLRLCTSGVADAICIAPLNKASMRSGGMNHPDEMNYFREVLSFKGKTVEFNVNNKLWTSRVTSHVPLKDVSRLITSELVAEGIKLLTEGLKQAGHDSPRIAVCGLNPHNGEGGAFGREEIEVIEPAVRLARDRGHPAVGPLPADTVFVRATRGEGEFDGVLTMYHDQGQIAMKMMSFGKGVTVHYGLPMPITTTSHGTAYEIVGKGIATPDALINALNMAAQMAATKLS